MSAVEIVRAIEKTVKQYGFLIAPMESGNRIVDYLRKSNLIHLFRVNKINDFIVLEFNVLSCNHECNTQCHNHNGYRDNECFTECVYACREERFRTLMDKIEELS
ncbi:MAG: hypothetical protein QXT53_03840 [Ignisphaera sp.]